MMHDPIYTITDEGCPNRLRGTSQQTIVGLLGVPPAGGLGSTSTVLIEGRAVSYASLHNRSGSTITVGVATRLPNPYWIAGQWGLAGGGLYADDTVDAQSTTAGDFPLETSVANTGYVVAALVKFGAISLNVSTPSSGGVPVRAVSYSNAAGSGWTTLSNLFVQDAAALNYATGENLVVFAPPSDWGKTQTGGLNGVPEGYYALRVQATTAPAQAAGAATCMEVLRFAVGTEAIVDNTTMEYSPNKGEIRHPESDGIAALFSTASVGNRATVHWRTC